MSGEKRLETDGETNPSGKVYLEGTTDGNRLLYVDSVGLPVATEGDVTLENACYAALAWCAWRLEPPG